MLYLVMIKLLDKKDQRIELFTSVDEAISFAKHIIRKDCKTLSDIEETDRNDGTSGLYYIGSIPNKMLITVYRKFIDCQREE